MTLEWVSLKVVLFAGLTVLTVLAAVAFIVLRNGRRPTYLVRRRVDCPVRERTAVVDFVMEGNGGEACVEVASCSLLEPGEPIECGTVCRSTAVAPFSARVDEPVAARHTRVRR
jgi:hypothetical protein